MAGAGFGTAFLGAFRSLALLAGPTHRAGLFAAMYVVSYLANSVPAVLAGMAVPSLGLGTTATGYGLMVIALALLAMLGAARLRPSRSATGASRVGTGVFHNRAAPRVPYDSIGWRSPDVTMSRVDANTQGASTRPASRRSARKLHADPCTHNRPSR